MRTSNRSATHFGPCIHELFEDQAEKTPNSTALICDEERVTYRELNQRSNQIAHYLQKRRVGPEVQVGLHLERSIETVTWVIAVLKAGGVYVPLDPSYPDRRLAEMIEDSRPPLIVSRTEICDRISGKGTTRICLDQTAAEIGREKTTRVSSGVTLDNASYVVFTSGSTGRPRGAVEIHRSMTTRLIASPLPDIQVGDICALNSSLSFGISASRLFLPLVTGVPVVIVPDNQVKDVEEFTRVLEKTEVSSICVVPALLRELLAGTELIWRLRRLRAVVVAGGTITADLLQSFRAKLPHVQILNAYGSTEIGTTALMRTMTDRPTAEYRVMGWAAPKTNVYLLNDNLDPVRDGMTGELCVGAAHLARGYLNRPDLTAERFAPDPFASLPGQRMCRTGDLARRLPNGEVEFLGRVDHQVKLRGFRIDLGEIESVLQELEHVCEAAVVLQEFEDDTRLVAYVAHGDEAEPSERMLLTHLRSRLPSHMVPAAFCSMKQLPTTAAGKIDRGALPRVINSRVDKDYTAPRNPTEAAMTEIWSDVFAGMRISVHDHFLDLGGHSLLATRVLSRIRDRFGVNVPLDVFFDRPTVAEMSEVVSKLGSILAPT